MIRLAASLLFFLISFTSQAATTSLTDLESHIAAIEHKDGQFSPGLVDPLLLLAAHHASTNQLETGLELYRRAQNILHRHEGIYNTTQIPIVNEMISLSVQLGEVDQASRMHVMIYTIYNRHHGESHPRTIEALVALAEWYQAFGQHDQASELLDEALKTLGDDPGVGKLKWQIVMAKLNSSYLRGRCCNSSLVTDALEDLLADPSADLSERGAALLTAADLLTIAGDSKAGNYYENYLRLASIDTVPAVPLGIARNDLMVRAYLRVVPHEPVSSYLPRGRLSGSPLAFCEVQLAGLLDRPIDSMQLSADLAVSKNGRVRDVEVISTSAPRTVVRLFERIARLTRFRPAFENGKPVDSIIRIEQRFSDEVDLVPEELALTSANIATFHGCHMLANFLEPSAGSPRIATVQ